MRYLQFLLGGILLLNACASSDDTMSLENSLTVAGFPNSTYISDGKQLEIDILGKESLSVQDSILIVSTRNGGGLWSVYDISSNCLIGSYLKVGRASVEVIFPPRVYGQAFYDKGKVRYCTIYDFGSGKLLDMNITETINHKSLSIAESFIKLERSLFNVVRIDSAAFFCRRVEGTHHTVQERFIISNGTESSNHSMDMLNEIKVQPGDDINILNASYCYNSERDILIEAPMYLNYLNAYSLKGGSTSTTIFQGDKAYTVTSVIKQSKRNRVRTYRQVVSYKDYFAALYEGKSRRQSIQFYDWELCPLASLELDKDINSFDIDLRRGILYTLNYETDEVWYYDIRKFLDQLHISAKGDK